MFLPFSEVQQNKTFNDEFGIPTLKNVLLGIIEAERH